MPDRALLSVFTPSRTRPEDLEAILVQRQDLLDDAIERVRESATTDNKHHLLFVGARGTGKTHLVTLLVHRLGLVKELNKDLRIAWLNEDETSTTLLELLRRIYLALTKRYPEEYSEESLEPMFDLGQPEAEQWLSQLLLKSLQNHTLLVVVENLDALFQGLGKSGQQKLRAFIQENPVLSLVATAQRLVDDLTKRTSAFFGFFQTEQLKPLSVKQAAELIGKIATLNGQAEIATFLHSATGQSRVRALHHLSGGNHRIYIVLSQFITRESIDDLVVPFTKMVDEMTPYYQERIRWLPPQQRKIIEYLCAQERPTSVKEMARKLFAKHQSISSQLMDLREKGYVQSSPRGRESLYEIAEPLMRICIEIKENQTREPLRMLVDFLRVWYDGQELSTRLKKCTTESMARIYLTMAIERNIEQGNLRARLLVDGYCAELGQEQASQWNLRIEAYAKEAEELALACGEWAKEDSTQALAIIDEITANNSSKLPVVKSAAWLLASEIHHEEAHFEKSITSLSEIIVLNATPQHTIRALLRRAIIYREIDKPVRAIEDYSRVINLTDAPVEQIAQAYISRGTAYVGLNPISPNAIYDYSAVIDLTGVPVDLIEQGYCLRGLIYLEQNDLDKASNDFEDVLKVKENSAFVHEMAYFALAITSDINGDWESVINSVTCGLREGRKHSNPRPDFLESILGSLCGNMLSARVMKNRIKDLVQAHQENEEFSRLGESLIGNLSAIYRNDDMSSNSNGLEAWVIGWEEACKEIDQLRLPLRIFRTGIDFIKSGGEDRGILLDLNQEERKVLEQALGLEIAS
ncbi:MAG: ArsR family transcriptional regulator [Gammaproteobacteria bacterium]|nr:ArsR family transcriptional regulator [Gammaproteobacteria bacterium]